VVGKTKAAANRAIELNPRLGEAYGALAIAQSMLEWNWHEAERSFRRSLELNPNQAHIRSFYGMVLMSQGRFAEAVAQQETAVRLDPLSQNSSEALGAFYYFTGDNDRALAQLEQTEELFGASVNLYQILGLVYCERGRCELGVELLEEARALSSDAPNQLAALAYAQVRAGRPAEARNILEQLQRRAETSFVSPVYRALVHVALGENDQALGALEQAYAMRFATLPLYAAAWPPLAPLRSDPRFADLMKRIRGDPP